MIVGDPDYFAIQFDIVSSWNVPEGTWRNGVFFIYVGGRQLFGFSNSFELKTTLGFYCSRSLSNAVCDVDLKADEVYKNAYEYFVSGEGKGLTFQVIDMTCTGMEDGGVFLYYMAAPNGDRMIWSADDGVTVFEELLPSGTVVDVILKLRPYSLMVDQLILGSV